MYIGAMDLHLLIVTIPLLALQLLWLQESYGAMQILTQYDGTGSSSSFGEPIFRLEPPNVINFVNTQGANILCLVSGSPRPTVTWYSSLDLSQTTTSGQMVFSDEISLQQTQPVNNVTNLRHIMYNGALLRLLPFKEPDFRQDIHSTEYRCVASNQLATIHSRRVLVQAVMSSANGNSGTTNVSGPTRAAGQDQEQQQMEVKVSDEFVALNSVAVFKCRASGGPEFSHLIEWFTSDGLQIRASDTSKANKFLAFRSGELHVNNVDMVDLQRTYGCRMRNSITNRMGSSSGLAQLIVTDSLESAADRDARNQPAAAAAANERAFRFTPQVVHSISQLIMTDPALLPAQPQPQQRQPPADQSEWRLLLPCAVRGPQARELRWYYQPAGGRPAADAAPHKPAVPLDQWAAARSLGVQHLAGANATGQRAAGRAQQQQPTSYVVGPTFLAIEWPTRAQSGRYTCQWAGGAGGQPRTLCDINVIVGQPIRLTMEPVLGAQGGEPGQAAASADYYASAAQSAASNYSASDSSWLSRLGSISWFGFGGSHPPRHPRSGGAPDRRRRRHAPGASGSAASPNPVLDGDWRRVQVRGPGVVSAPPIVGVGQRLQLDCRGSGHPIEGVKWFRNGQSINTQSSNDFQIEITSPLLEQAADRGQAQPEVHQANLDGGQGALLSSLTIRQVQAKDIGLNVFECFAHNSLGDRARAGLAVFVAERPLLDWARAACPAGNDTAWLRADGAGEPASAEDEPDDADASQPGVATFKRHNPLQRALVLESEPVELRCPSVQQPPAAAGGRLRAGTRIEWRRLAAAKAPDPSAAAAAAANRHADSDRARSLNQLFGGDSRFVINGSSLQIRSPSKRYDESVYVCRPASAEPAGSAPSQSHEPLGPPASQPPQRADSSLLAYQAAAAGPVHQSSLAPPSAAVSLQQQSCDSLLDALLFRDGDSQQQLNQAGYSPPPPPPMSSISIRIVAKPKIDPFEFSRNLEEGMRAVVVCTVISGQSPVDITWFRDGEFLLPDEQISVDQSNGFSSTLTFHRIQPNHMGLYTCVASNAFASTNHTSKLVVNVAPYFIDPPQNTRAILGSNVLVDCRAGGQPSPQIRWRKLVSVGAGAAAASLVKVAPASGSQAKPVDAFGGAGNNLDSQLDQINDFGAQAAQFPSSASNLNSLQNRFEFRIVTSNSHIQILENGSMIIKEVELADASRYVCQAFNGINPSLSEVIELTVLSPAQFDVHYETVSVKRDSMIKFNCAPRGDQPLQIEWHKEGKQLVPPAAAGRASENTSYSQQLQSSKYNEIAHLHGPSVEPRQRHSSLVIGGHLQGSNQTARPLVASSEGMKMSELLISYADRGDTGAFVCVAKNAFGKDELTYRLIVQEPPDMPTGVQAQGVQSKSARLVWLAPFDGNLPLSHFVIEYRKLAPHAGTAAGQQDLASAMLLATQPDAGRLLNSEWTRLVVSTGQLSQFNDDSTSLQAAGPPTQIGQSQSVPNALISGRQLQQKSISGQYSLTLRQLQARSTYHIRVAAVNGIGQSGFSPPIAVVTAEEPPNSRPDDLRAQPVSSSSIRVLWRGPALLDEQAPVKGYYVSHRKLQAGSKDESSPQAQLAVAQQSQLWLATGSISAANSSNYRPQDQQQELPVASLKQYGGAGGNSVNGADYEYMLNSLDKNTRYEIRVQPYNSMGVGPASDTVGQTLKFDRPGQPNLKFVSSRRQSFELKWTIADDQPLMGFSLFYKCEYDDWQEIQLGIIYHYVIENLRCGNKYQIYLSAFNVVGRSDPSDVLSVRTEGTVPIAPDKSQFVRANITEVVLDMSGWQSGGCPISSFMIQFKRLHDTNWFILSEGATPFAMSDKISIPDLVPATWYKLLVTALNEAGSTNSEYLFATLTTSGKQIAPTEGAHSKDASSTGGWLAGAGEGAGRGGMFSSLSQLLFAGSGSGGNQQPDQGQLLLPMSCILLLLVTMLASYLYYSRSSAQSPASEQRKLTSSASSSHRPATQLIDQVHHMQACRSSAAGNTLSREEKQLIQSSDQLHHQLMNANSLPLDASGYQQQFDGLQQQQQHADQMLDSLVSHTTLQSLMGTSTNPRPAHQGRLHGMRLLSSGNIFSSLPSGGNPVNAGCTNSSLSTQSTNCNFDCGASSSQASSSGTSGCGAKAKLQLIDESSLISDPNNEPIQLQQQQQQFHYGQQQLVGTCNMSSPGHHQIYNPSGVQHVDLIDPTNESRSQQLDSANQMIEATNSGNLFINDYGPDCNNRCYGQRLVSTSSFASAADLMQRQQKMYNQKRTNEPIYQRLDSFQAAQGGLPVSKQQQFATISNQAKSNTIHSNGHTSMDDFCIRSITMNRAQPFQLESESSQYPNGLLYLPPIDLANVNSSNH